MLNNKTYFYVYKKEKCTNPDFWTEAIEERLSGAIAMLAHSEWMS